MSETQLCSKCGLPTHINDLDAKDDGTGNYTILECGDCYGPGYRTTEGWTEMGARTRNIRKDLKLVDGPAW